MVFKIIKDGLYFRVTPSVDIENFNGIITQKDALRFGGNGAYVEGVLRNVNAQWLIDAKQAVRSTAKAYSLEKERLTGCKETTHLVEVSQMWSRLRIDTNKWVMKEAKEIFTRYLPIALANLAAYAESSFVVAKWTPAEAEAFSAKVSQLIGLPSHIRFFPQNKQSFTFRQTQTLFSVNRFIICGVDYVLDGKFVVLQKGEIVKHVPFLECGRWEGFEFGGIAPYSL